MSVRTMARVWQFSRHGGADLLMMLAIADFSDDDGNAYPSVGTLAIKCRMKPRNAVYVLGRLQVSGELKVLRGGGPRGVNRYRITVEEVQRPAPLQAAAPMQAVAGEGCNALQGPPATDCTTPLQPVAPKPSINHQLTIKEPSVRRKRASVSDDDLTDLTSGVDPQALKDWIAVRKAKLTRTAMLGLIREAEKAGLTVNEAVTLCAEKGWRSLNARWLTGKPDRRSPASAAGFAVKDYSKGFQQ